MAIIKVNNTSEESSVNFLTNQSSILYASDTNKITVNGVNVFVIKPKVGDIMCVTRYTDEGGALLPADQQQVKWIDGLSINPKQLSLKYELVGICVAINGNKAMVRYREDSLYRWSVPERWEMPQLMPLINGKSHTFQMRLCVDKYDDKDYPNLFEYHYTELPSAFEQELDFVNQLNDWFLANNSNYSAEIVDKNTDLPILQDPGQYRIIVNDITRNKYPTFHMYGKNGSPTINPTNNVIYKHIEAINWCYKNNGFKTNILAGFCRAMCYDYINNNGYENAPTEQMTSIDSTLPVKKAYFDSHSNCQILRDNFANYDEYLESFMIKFPCGAGGQITEFPSGKENTYKLANYTFLNNKTGKQEPLYKAANWAASIDVNAPKLGKGNWWIPSVAEMAQMMRDITYGTKLWETNPDIVNRVLEKLLKYNIFGYGFWSMLSASTVWGWATSSRYDNKNMYIYSGSYKGFLHIENFKDYDALSFAITIYEF